uniref:Uncharacterized protein n=1 Tax=Arundo donax TaxID=35708 RepID=A0A0A9FJ04_ARUDO
MFVPVVIHWVLLVKLYNSVNIRIDLIQGNWATVAHTVNQESCVISICGNMAFWLCHDLSFFSLSREELYFCWIL